MSQEPFTDRQMNFDVEDTRRKLTAMRAKLGAGTPAGHRCSNLIQQLEEHRTAEGERKERGS